jgi:hypothetical protein
MRCLSLFAGTSEIMKLIISRGLGQDRSVPRTGKMICLIDGFVKIRRKPNFVIPAKAGFQYFKKL